MTEEILQQCEYVFASSVTAHYPGGVRRTIKAPKGCMIVLVAATVTKPKETWGAAYKRADAIVKPVDDVKPEDRPFLEVISPTVYYPMK